MDRPPPMGGLAAGQDAGALVRCLAASIVPLVQPVAQQDDRYHQERQGEQERLIRCEIAEPLDGCHDSLHEAGQAAGNRARKTLQRQYAAVRKDCTKAGALRIKIL